MSPEGSRPANFETALNIFSTSVDLWVKLTQCIPRGFIKKIDLFNIKTKNIFLSSKTI